MIGFICHGDIKSFVSDCDLTMVNPDGFLEDEDMEFSSPRSRRHDTSFNHNDSQDESVHDGDHQRDTENESDGDDDVKEIGPSYPSINIAYAQPSQSGANIGSEDAAHRKRSSTPLRASSVESCSDPKRRKVKDVMNALLGRTGLDESKFVKLGPAAWGMAKQVFHSPSTLWPTKDCNAFMAKYLQLLPKQKKV